MSQSDTRHPDVMPNQIPSTLDYLGGDERQHGRIRNSPKNVSETQVFNKGNQEVGGVQLSPHAALIF